MASGAQSISTCNNVQGFLQNAALCLMLKRAVGNTPRRFNEGEGSAC